MPAVQRELVIEQGATFLLAFAWHHPGEVEGVPGEPHDLTGFSVRMQIRKKRGAPIIVDASTDNGKITIGVPLGGGTPDPTNGRITVILTDEDTDLLTVTTCAYDLEAEDPVSGFVYRLLEGGVTVKPNITQDDPV